MNAQAIAAVATPYPNRLVAARQPGDMLPGFEVHVAAGQVWMVMPGRLDCRAMYPDHARTLSAAIDAVAGQGGTRTIVVAVDVALVIAQIDGDLVAIREDDRRRPRDPGVAITPVVAHALAWQFRDAADRADRGLGRRAA